MASVAQIAIIPMQDVLGLGQNGRMNKPGTVKHNWIWKMSASGFDKKLGARLLEITQRYGR
jgi:4-alpha-glucanotransferase